MKLNYDGYLNEYALWSEVEAINLEKEIIFNCFHEESSAYFQRRTLRLLHLG
jgi:hypothetical protein